MERRGKQSKIYRTEILQTSICIDEETKVKYKGLKYCSCQYADTKKAK